MNISTGGISCTLNISYLSSS